MVINYDDVEEVKIALKKEENKLLKVKIKVKQLKMVIKGHEKGTYNPDLMEELMKRCKSPH